jgi:hypothetical protein
MEILRPDNYGAALQLVVVAGLFAGFGVEMVKPLFKRFLAEWMSDWLIRVAAISFGLAIGLIPESSDADFSLLRLCAGGVGGMFSTIIYAKVRAYLENFKPE